jgi:hypothetical protein
MEFRDKVKEDIKSKKPKLSKQSIITYASILSNLYAHIWSDGKYNMEKFNDVEPVIAFLKNIESNKRKTILSALYGITGKKEYRDLMISDIDKYNEKEHKQEMSDNQRENWVSKNEITTLSDTLQKTADYLYKKQGVKTMIDLQEIQQNIILCLLGGMYIPPRRSKDYVDFKIKNINKETDNYIEGNKLVFNSYKTAKFYGSQTIDLPKELKSILTKWIKINPTDYLLFDSKGLQLSNVKLNQRLNKLFEKKISVNQLRHSYLSDKYQSTIETNKALARDMEQMGSSRAQEKTYIKTL